MKGDLVNIEDAVSLLTDNRFTGGGHFKQDGIEVSIRNVYGDVSGIIEVNTSDELVLLVSVLNLFTKVQSQGQRGQGGRWR